MSAACPVYGFVVTIVPRDGSTNEALDAMRDDFPAALAAHGLDTVGADPRALEYVVRRDGSQATNADRDLVRAWAELWTDAAEVRISDLVDLSA